MTKSSMLGGVQAHWTETTVGAHGELDARWSAAQARASEPWRIALEADGSKFASMS